MRYTLATLWLLLVLAGASLATSAMPRPQPEQPEALRRTAHIEDPSGLGVGRLLPDLPIRGLDGAETTLSALLKGRRGVVLCMTSATCPLSIKYGPRLAAMAAEYDAKGVLFVLVNVSDAEDRGDMRDQVRELKWKRPYLPDQDRVVRRALRPRTTTEVFAIDAARTLVYRGAVDDQFGVGTALDSPRRTFLRDALAALLEQRPPEVRATWAPGCVVESDGGNGAPSEAAPLTYYGRISRIVQDRCAACHHAGGPAPFTLETYESLADRAKMIDAVVRDGIMPPWHAAPTPGPSPWRHDRSLPEDEKADLLRWLGGDRPRGDPSEAPVPRTHPLGWKLGKPDLLLSAPGVRLPAEGPMVYGSVLVQTGLTHETWVDGIEILPRRRDSVHHALLFLLPSGENGAGSDLGLPGQLIATYGAGYSTVEHPAGSAIRLPAGATLLLKVYCMPMGEPMREQVRIGLRFAKGPVVREVRSLAATAPDLVIPPGAKNVAATANITLPEDGQLAALVPSLRSHGRSIRYDVLFPDGREVTLLEVPRYDFKWRPRYELLEPLHVPKGTAIRCSAVFDNSAENPNNGDPEREVRHGWEATEDMLLGALEYLVPAPQADTQN